MIKYFVLTTHGLVTFHTRREAEDYFFDDAGAYALKVGVRLADSVLLLGHAPASTRGGR